MTRAMTIKIDTHADDYNFAIRRKLQNRSFGELPRKKRTGQASDLFNQIMNRSILLRCNKVFCYFCIEIELMK